MKTTSEGKLSSSRVFSKLQHMEEGYVQFIKVTYIVYKKKKDQIARKNALLVINLC